jgi:chromosome segregation ATPase
VWTDCYGDDVWYTWTDCGDGKLIRTWECTEDVEDNKATIKSVQKEGDELKVKLKIATELLTKTEAEIRRNRRELDEKDEIINNIKNELESVKKALKAELDKYKGPTKNDVDRFGLLEID